ncbi:cell division protein FtsZ, partial [Bifidobacterium sp. 6T3]|nr:cell division protein FtsZ [Bifidobacterium phasiani]
PATPVAPAAPTPLVQPKPATVPTFTPSGGDAASRSFDETSEHDVISLNESVGDLDIPDFLR